VIDIGDNDRKWNVIAHGAPSLAAQTFLQSAQVLQAG
jgi:hypothetical protein